LTTHFPAAAQALSWHLSGSYIKRWAGTSLGRCTSA